MGKSKNIRLFGATFNISRDEVGLPALCGAFARIPGVLLGLVMVLIVFGYIGLDGCSTDSLSEKQDELLDLYSLVSLGVMIVSFLAYVCLFLLSSRGDIFEDSKRGLVVPAIYVLVLLYLFETAMSIFGLQLAVEWEKDFNQSACLSKSEQKLRVLWAWVIGSFFDVLTFLAFLGVLAVNQRKRNLRLKGFTHLDEIEQSAIHWKATCANWMKWIACLSCGLAGKLGSGETDDVLEHAAEAFSRWFSGHNLQRASDILVGVILLRAEQTRRNENRMLREMNKDDLVLEVRSDPNVRKISAEIDMFLWGDRGYSKEERKAKVSRIPKKASKPVFELKPSAVIIHKANQSLEPDSIKAIEEAEAYMPISIAVNGWQMKLFLDLKKRSVMSLCRTILPCGKPSFAHGDCCRGINAFSFLSMTGLNPEDVIYASWIDREGIVIPYAVVVNHKLKSVIITCRGSLSINDILTDAMVKPKSLIQSGKRWGFDGRDSYAHTGFLQIAENIRSHLQAHGTLHKLLGKTPVAKVDIDLENEKYRLPPIKAKNLPHCVGYKLVITGHSLGGGVAATLSLLLRPEFPEVRCIGFSAPGCVFNKRLAEESQEWILLPFVGKDIVPHLSFHTLLKVRGQLLEMIRRSKVNKNKVLRSATSRIPAEDLLYDESEVPDTPERNAILQQLETLAAQAHPDNESNDSLETIRMYPPGRILHFARTEKFSHGFCCGILPDHEYHASWIEDRDEMDDISISPYMFLDHLPDFCADVIGRVREAQVGKIEDNQTEGASLGSVSHYDV